MKPISLLFTALGWITSLVILPAQTPHLVKEGNEWNTVAWPTFSPNFSSYRERIGEDTLIGNHVYSKVYISHDEQGTNWVLTNSFLRQDSANQVFYKYWTQEEFLLYDFNLEVNDTFFVEGFCDQVVMQIATIKLNNGGLRKRMKMVQIDQFGDYHYWIEGVGHSCPKQFIL